MFGIWEVWVEERQKSKQKFAKWRGNGTLGIQRVFKALEKPLQLGPFMYYLCFFEAVFPKTHFTDHLHQPPGDTYEQWRAWAPPKS